jgi:DNA polymerase III alpha subunit (gram-positive type)
MSGLEFYIYDSETTGLKNGFHEITEMACIHQDTKLQFHRVVRPQFPQRASLEALAITQKTMADLQEGVYEVDAMDAFENFLNLDGKTRKHRVLVAHNCNFDMKFIHALWSKHNREFPADLWVDTIPMAKKFAAEQGLQKDGEAKLKFNLHASIDMLGSKKVKGIHNAVSDARNLFFLWQRLLEEGIDPLDNIKPVPHVL